MKIAAYALAAHVKQPLLPLYFVTSADMGQYIDIQQTLHAAFTQGGDCLCIRYTIDTYFDWTGWLQDVMQAGLFGERRFFILTLLEDTPSAEAKKALACYLQAPADDICIMIQSPPFPMSFQKSAWFTALEKQTGFIPLWPPTSREHTAWIQQQSRKAGFSLSDAALTMMSTFTLGNRIAASQCLEKLRLCYPPNTSLSETHIAHHLGDESTHDVFDWMTHLRNGDISNSLRIVYQLEGAGTELTLVLWGLSKTLKDLLLLQHAVSQGLSLEEAFSKLKIWDKQKPSFQKALKRGDTAPDYAGLLSQCATVDGYIKQGEAALAWRAIRGVCQEIAGGRK